MSFAELRNRYIPQESDCPCFVNGQSCSPAQLVVRSMNFGQHWRTLGITDAAYQAYLPKAFVMDYLEKELGEYVEDSKQFPNFEDPLENSLRAKQWPSLTEIFEDATLASLAMKRFGYEILSNWFGGSPVEQEPGFVINTIDFVSIKNGNPYFVGKARIANVPVTYQDV